MLQVVHKVSLQTQTFPAPLLRKPVSQKPPGMRLAGAPPAPHGRGGKSRDATWAALRTTRPARGQRACVNDAALAQTAVCACAKAEVRRKLHVGGGASAAVLPFRRRRACSATPPVAGCGSPSPGVVSASLPRLAYLRASARLQASRASLLSPAGAGAAGREQLGPGGMGSPGVGLSRDGGTSPLPLPERGDPPGRPGAAPFPHSRLLPTAGCP